MTSILKMTALVLSLGIDTLMMAVSLGVLQTKGKFRIAFTFACAEMFMPLVGLAIGQGTGHVVGHFASFIGGILLLGVGVWFVFFEDENEEHQKFGKKLTGWTLILTALSISVDELAVGFSIGVVGVPIRMTVVFIALQAFVFTLVGLALGARLKPFLGEWAEKLAGIVLGLFGLWILADPWIHFPHT